MIEFEADERPGALVVRLRGSLDAYLRDFTPDVEKRLRAKERHLIIDLSGVDFMGSRGIGLLFGLNKLLKDLGKRLLLAAPSRAVTEALEVGGMGSLLDIRADVEEALAACGKDAPAPRRARASKPAKKPRRPKG